MAPVPLALRHKDPNLVGLGSYIVNVQAGCNDCDTNPPWAAGHDPTMGQQAQVNVAGYMAGGMAFGPFISRNVTPDKNGLPAGLTYATFVHTFKTGWIRTPSIRKSRRISRSCLGPTTGT